MKKSDVAGATVTQRLVCDGCDQEVREDWYCCPYCGYQTHIEVITIGGKEYVPRPEKAPRV